MRGRGATAPGRRDIPVWAVDALLGIAVTVVMAAVIHANHGGRNDPDALAYFWSVGLGSLMLVRRRYPVLVLAISVLALFAYYAAGYPAVGVAVPIAAALYSAAEFGRMSWAIGAGLLTLATSLFFRLAEGQELSLVVGYELADHTVLIAAAIALGDSVRSRRALLAHTREIVALTSERTQRESEARAQAERITVARDLHDSIGHSTSVVSLHAEVAREAVARQDTVAATTALRFIKDTTASAMTELRRTVTVLREPGRPLRITARLSDLPEALDAGVEVEFTSDLRLPGDLPDVVDATAFRIVQEAVTNIVKHSTATRARVAACIEDGEFRLSVTDEGTPVADGDPNGTGHGLRGMRERVTALGGTLEAGPVDGGFRVHATIPVASRP